MKEIQGKAVLDCDQSQAIKTIYAILLDLHGVVANENNTSSTARDARYPGAVTLSIEAATLGLHNAK